MTARHPAISAPVKHVFVDYENMHELDLKLFGSEGVHLTLLLGPTQKKLDAAVVEELLEHAAAVQLVRLTSVGRNAVDFALTYYLGRATALDPAGRFLIVTKDKGYDPLVEHLRSRSLDVWREANWGAPAAPAAPMQPPPAPALPVAQPERKPGPPPRPATILANSGATAVPTAPKPPPPAPALPVAQPERKPGPASRPAAVLANSGASAVPTAPKPPQPAPALPVAQPERKPGPAPRPAAVLANSGATAIPTAPKPPPPAPALPVAQPERKPGPAPRPATILDDWEGRVLEFLRRGTTTRPSTSKKLASWISTHLGNKASEAEVADLIERLGQAGHLFIDANGKVTYHLEPA
jgi:hypothetical protein